MSFGGLSATCVSNLTTVLSTPPLSTCTASGSLLSSFFPVLIGGGNASSLVQPLNSYLGAVCPAPLCSNQTILTGLNSINSACGDVLGDFGLTNMTIATYVPILPAIKGVLCTQQVNSTAPASANNTEYCVTETLSTVETLIGRPITASFLLSILQNPAAITRVFNTTLLGNSSAICTDCTKALYTGVIDIVNSTLIRDAAALSNTTQSSVASTLMRAVAGVCGPSFVNGTRPTSIRNGTNTNPSATASASARPSTGAATSVSSSSYAVSALALAGMAGALLI